MSTLKYLFLAVAIETRFSGARQNLVRRLTLNLDLVLDLCSKSPLWSRYAKDGLHQRSNRASC